MMRNKLFTGLAAVTILSLFFGCASTDDGIKEVVYDANDMSYEQSDESDEEQEINESDALLVTTEEESAYTIESDVPLTAKDSKKNYTGWISSSIRPVTSTVGNIRINVRPKKGTFSLAVMNDAEKAIPVLSTANEYTTTSLYLKAGKKLLKLCDDSNVVSAARKTAKGISILYTIDKSASVILDFECIASTEGYKEDTIKVTATVQSLAKKKQDFALKFLLDTVLGETDRHHFYTSDDSPVKGEVLYHSMKDEKFVTSKNAKANMQIILDGADITPIESVALANFTTVDTKKWEADMTTFRSFDTVLSYNNSAVAIYWPKVTLEPEEEYSEVFYLSVAAGDAIPGGAAYINALTEQLNGGEEAQEEDQTQTAASQKEPSVQNIQAVKEQEPVKTEPKPEPAKTEPKTQSISAVDEKTPGRNSAISEDKLTYDYIQMLLDKIESLEEGDPDVNKEEINALNSELDAILEILNSR